MSRKDMQEMLKKTKEKEEVKKNQPIKPLKEGSYICHINDISSKNDRTTITYELFDAENVLAGKIAESFPDDSTMLSDKLGTLAFLYNKENDLAADAEVLTDSLVGFEFLGYARRRNSTMYTNWNINPIIPEEYKENN